VSAVVRGCGCSEAYDPELDGWVMVEQCQEHASQSKSAEYSVGRLLDHELDASVHEAAGGKRVNRIYPADHTR
jgi:hypothetical protein